MRNKFLLLLFVPSLLFAQMSNPQPESSNPPVTNSDTSTNSKYSIEYFSFKDLSGDLYTLSIVSDKPDELIDELNGKKEKKLRIQIGEVKTDILLDSAKKDSDNPNVINFLVAAYYKIETGKKQIKLFSRFPNTNEVLESTLDFEVPVVNDQPGKQPYIEK
ncbi:MAG TPA: hypothetical protein PLG41_18420, partial [Leptospiraceae bacterium]|nr:hypothetical protein [Leptospiraceae bacterium]